VVSGLIVFPIAEAVTVMRGYRDVVAEAPDELTVQPGFFTTPDGQAMLFLFPLWSGDLARGEHVVGGLEKLGRPAMAQTSRVGYADALAALDSHVVNGNHYYVRTRSLPEATEESIEILVAAARTATSPFSGLGIHHFHGAASRVPAEATAFGPRRDHLMVEIIASWSLDDDERARHERWADDLSGELAPHALPGGYPNLLGPDDHERLALAYGPNLPRLLEAKRRYDPDGVFSFATGTISGVPA
jgi:hypothetical protein